MSPLCLSVDQCPAVFVCFGCVSTHLYDNLNGLSADRGHGAGSGQIFAL